MSYTIDVATTLTSKHICQLSPGWCLTRLLWPNIVGNSVLDSPHPHYDLGVLAMYTYAYISKACVCASPALFRTSQPTLHLWNMHSKMYIESLCIFKVSIYVSIYRYLQFTHPYYDLVLYRGIDIYMYIWTCICGRVKRIRWIGGRKNNVFRKVSCIARATSPTIIAN